MLATRLASISRAASKRVPFAFSRSFAVKLPDLPYEYDALEPYIDAETMLIHHSKHHNAYVTNFNIATEAYEEAKAANDTEKMAALQPALKFNGGGHINHTIFWQNLSPKGGGEPTGELADAINAAFGSFEEFKTKFNATTAGIQGSGWGWLGYNKATGGVEIATTSNQDPLLDTHGLVPLLGVDVWEHAYYLNYRNVRPDYLTAIWNVVNFDDVAYRLAEAKK